MVSNSIYLSGEQWSKGEQVDPKHLSEWKRISTLKEKLQSAKQKILNDPDVKDTLTRLHDDFVLVPADKAANNVTVVCKKYHIETLIKDLGINTTNISPKSTYIPSVWRMSFSSGHWDSNGNKLCPLASCLTPMRVNF